MVFVFFVWRREDTIIKKFWEAAEAIHKLKHASVREIRQAFAREALLEGTRATVRGTKRLQARRRARLAARQQEHDTPLPPHTGPEPIFNYDYNLVDDYDPAQNPEYQAYERTTA